MGREVRRVALDFEPPREPCRFTHGRMSEPCPGWHYHPHFDETYAHATAEWDAGKLRWESGEDPDALKYPKYSYEEWHGSRPGDPKYYRPEWPEGTPLGYCLYETVSEGTPLSPVFAEAEQLAAWMGSNEIWGQRYTYEQALAFVAEGWAPSFVMDERGIRDGVTFVAESRAEQ